MEIFEEDEEQRILEEKDIQIRELEERVAALEQEKEEIIENFQISTEVLVERLKELEGNSLGERPQTARVLENIDVSRRAELLHDPLEERLKGRPQGTEEKSFEKSRVDPREEDKNESGHSTGTIKCPNCGEEIESAKMATHTVSCYRSSTKCKICGERISKSMKKAHLLGWRSPERIQKAISSDNETELQQILDHGVPVDQALEPDRHTLLHLCALHNANSCLLFLLGRRCKTELLDKQGRTALILAMQEQNEKVALSLIDLGANINCKEKAGKTPLMIACQTGNKPIFRALIKAGANLHITSTLGDTALTLAQKNGQQELALKLVKNGASIRKKTASLSKLSLDRPHIMP